MKKILIYNSGGGLGDSIQLFPLLISLINYYKKAKFFYLGAHQNHFKDKLKEYNIDIETVDLDLKYFDLDSGTILTKKRALEKISQTWSNNWFTNKIEKYANFEDDTSFLFFSRTFNGIF